MPDLISQIASSFPDNTTGLITPAIQRAFLTAFVNAPSSPAQLNLGSISGTVALNASASQKQRATIGAATTFTTTGWPPAGTYGEIELQLINGGVGVTWPTINWLIGDGTNSTTFSSMGVVLNASGTNFVVMWSTDGGATIFGKAV